jgi:hypothetical protein
MTRRLRSPTWKLELQHGLEKPSQSFEHATPCLSYKLFHYRLDFSERSMHHGSFSRNKPSLCGRDIPRLFVLKNIVVIAYEKLRNMCFKT